MSHDTRNWPNPLHVIGRDPLLVRRTPCCGMVYDYGDPLPARRCGKDADPRDNDPEAGR